MSHLVLVLHLYGQRQREPYLSQLSDAHPILGAVELGCVVVLIDEEDGEGCEDGRRGRRAIFVQLSGLQTEIEDKEDKLLVCRHQRHL